MRARRKILNGIASGVSRNRRNFRFGQFRNQRSTSLIAVTTLSSVKESLKFSKVKLVVLFLIPGNSRNNSTAICAVDTVHAYLFLSFSNKTWSILMRRKIFKPRYSKSAVLLREEIFRQVSSPEDGSDTPNRRVDKDGEV